MQVHYPLSKCLYTAGTILPFHVGFDLFTHKLLYSVLNKAIGSNLHPCVICYGLQINGLWKQAEFMLGPKNV